MAISSTEDRVGCAGPAHEVPQENNSDCIQTILVIFGKVCGFFLSLIQEVRLESFGLVILAVAISRQLSIGCVRWLFLCRTTLREDKQGKIKYKIHSLGRERGAGTVTLKPRPVLQEMRSLRKAYANGIKGVVISGKDPTQLSSNLGERKQSLFNKLKFMQL